ncbi:hypothetical protein AGMMS49974_00450 [Deltaproteobacteria bacterium]|nr:hypothetical protein AGMMS49974_00450 [Deltaproteobacteria bacterium]
MTVQKTEKGARIFMNAPEQYDLRELDVTQATTGLIIAMTAHALRLDIEKCLICRELNRIR